MSDTSTWTTTEHTRQLLLLEPRGAGTRLELTLECTKPLSAEVVQAALEEVKQAAMTTLTNDPAVQDFLRLRDKAKETALEKTRAELLVDEREAQRRQHVLAPFSAGDAEKLQQLENDLRTWKGEAAAQANLLQAVEEELRVARLSAEQVLRAHLGQAELCAVDRYGEQRDSLLAELCATAGPTLTKLAEVLQRCKGVLDCRGDMQTHKNVLDELQAAKGEVAAEVEPPEEEKPPRRRVKAE